MPAVAARAVGIGRAGEDKDGKDYPDRYDNLESMRPHTHSHLTMHESTGGVELPPRFYWSRAGKAIEGRNCPPKLCLPYQGTQWRPQERRDVAVRPFHNTELESEQAAHGS